MDPAGTSGVRNRLTRIPAPVWGLAAWCVLVLPWFRRLGVPIGDTGKELGVPVALAEGALLYRDVFWPYGPLPAYANAAAVRLFGVHCDVIAVAGLLLGLAVCLAVCRVVAKRCGVRAAVGAAVGVAAFPCTSSQFALPYSFGTLWACLLALVAADLLADYAEGEGGSRGLLAAGVLTGLIGLSKITVTVYVGAAACLAIALRQRALRPRPGHGSRLGEGIRDAAMFTVPALAVAVPVLALFLCAVPAKSLYLQALGGFHAANIRLGHFYPKLGDLLFPFRDPRPAALAAAAVVWCPMVFAAAAVGLLVRALRGPRPVRPAAIVWAGFAAANLTQLTASCHAPYLFPAAVTAFLVVRGGASGRKGGRAAGAAAVAAAGLIVFGARLPGILNRSMRVRTATYHRFHEPERGLALVRLGEYLGAAAVPRDRVGIFTGHDYIHRVFGIPNRHGYYHTLYEPFHDSRAEEEFFRRVDAAGYRILILTDEESFTYAYCDPISQDPRVVRLLAGYERVDLPAVRPFAVYRRRDADAAGGSLP